MKKWLDGILLDMTDEEIANLPQGQQYVGLSYEEIVSTLIRERYSIDDELAIQRQRDNKVEEFEQYYAYCEECKAKAKEIVAEEGDI